MVGERARKTGVNQPVFFAVHNQAGGVETSSKKTTTMAVNEPDLGSSAGGKGEKGIDRSFERTGTPMYLGE